MKIEITHDTVRVSDVPALGGRQAASFQAKVSAALPAHPGVIEVNLDRTTSMDCRGLEALAAILDHALRRNRAAELRVVDPSPPVRQLLSLTRLHRIFPVIQRAAGPGNPP